MRFIIKEQPYEKPLAAGKWRYERDGEPTGAVEHWRLTEAADGYRFLRVDLDGRAAKSGQTTLYHALLNGDGRVERLKFRSWGSGSWRVAGDVLFEDGMVTAARQINGQSYEQMLAVPSEFAFWFPASSGLGLLASLPDGPHTAVSLTFPSPNQKSKIQNPKSAFALFQTNLELQRQGDELAIRWEGNERRLWLDEQNWPVKMVREDGLTAVNVRMIRYH